MKKGLHILILIGLTSFMYGCGENKTSSVSTQNQGGSSRGGLPPVDYRDLEDGDFENRQVSFELDLDSELTGYDSVELMVDIGEVMGNGLDTLYGGDVLAYVDYSNGSQAIRFFSSGGNTRADVEENYWYYSRTNRKIWRGVFEGPQGALIIVIDGVYSSGDGSPEFDLMSGSVWIKPWPVVSDPGVSERPCVVKEDGRVDCKNPSGPLVRCWNVSLGPYDCRFNISDDGQVVESDYSSPNNPYAYGEYIKLGTFDDLSKRDTFKEEY